MAVSLSLGGTYATSPRRLTIADLPTWTGAAVRKDCRGAEVQSSRAVEQRARSHGSQLLPVKGRFPRPCGPEATRSGMHALHAAQTAASNE